MNDQSVAATRVYGVGHKAQHHLAPLRKIQRVGGLGPLTTIITITLCVRFVYV